MVYDLLCLFLLVTAFAGGYQRGLLRTFSFMIALLLGMCLTLFAAPYLASFLKASMVDPPAHLQSGILAIILLITIWLLHILLTMLWKKPEQQKKNFIPQTVGGLLLSSIMLLSISVFTTFIEQSGIMAESIRKTSYLYGWMAPINDKTADTWVQIKSGLAIVQEPT